jgi:hypothetical protein
MTFIHIPFTFKLLGVLLFLTNMDHITEYISEIWEKNKNKTLNDLLVEAIWNGSYMYTFIKHRCGKLYSTFPLVRSFATAISGPKTPVIEYPWASITQLIEESSGKLRVIEDRFDLTDFEWQYKSVSENLLKLNHICKGVLQNNPMVVECLLLLAENETAIRSQVINRQNMDKATDKATSTNVDEPPNMVTTKFLLIDYLHPTLDESYGLVIDRPYFIEGNHILSGAFVGRLLLSQGYSGTFDTSYRVAIIDQEVKMVEWTYSDYIELADNRKYMIRTFDEAPKSNLTKKASENSSPTEDEETKSWDKAWDKVDKE